MFSTQYANAHSRLNDFTHGGRCIANAYRYGKGIGASFTPEDVRLMIDHADAVGIQASVGAIMVYGCFDRGDAARLIASVEHAVLGTVNGTS